jgi:hypothetical protein
MKKLNKKAVEAADSMIFVMIFAVAVVSLFAILVFMFTYYSSDTVKLPEGLETYLLTQRFTRSPDCFVYEDVSGRSYPFTLDWDKFSEESLNECYVSPANIDVPAFRLRLSFSEGGRNIQTSNWNDDKGPDLIKSPQHVFVYYNNKKYNGQFTLGIQDA